MTAADRPRRRWIRAALALGAAGTQLPGCGTPPGRAAGGAAGAVAPAVRGPRDAGEIVVAPGGADPTAVPEWRDPREPFTLGVASGVPRADGATLWTRIAPVPLADGGGAGDAPVRVRWEVRDVDGGPVLRSGVAVAEPAWAHAVRIDLRGLAPGRGYAYRFASGDAVGPTGRFRTAPAPGQGTRLRLAFGSCQQFEQGRYGAWRHAVADDPDLVVFLGDYVYESSWGRRRIRSHDPGEPTTLEAYRRRHALYRGDADLQQAHRACAWVVTWDDHEVENDYADDRSQHGVRGAAFLARRAAAYRAYFEHLPLPWSMAPRGASMRVHGALDWGGLARIHVLDDRQYRSVQACVPPDGGGSRTVGPECVERGDPSRTMLGAPQEAWLDASLRGSHARWNLIAQQTLIGRCDRRRGAAEGWWTDGWDGYPAARRRLLESVRASGASNPLALGGDVHAFYAGELHEDFDRPSATPAMLEFVGGSITSQGPGAGQVAAQLAENPNLRWGAGGVNGYARIDLGRDGATVAMRALDDVRDPQTGCRTIAEFALRPGDGRLRP